MLDVRRADVGLRLDAERDDRAGERRRALHDARVVRRWRPARRRSGRPRGSPPLASAIASADSKNPRWASPTLVQTRTSGSAMPTSVRISPAWFMPSSTTAISGRPRSSSSDSGRPMWLFRLPLFLNTRNRAASSSATTSFVVVLPALPVIATTLRPERRRTSRASACSAARRVVDFDDQRRPPRPCLEGSRHHVDHRTDGPAPQRIGDEPVAVEPLATNRHEQVSRCDCARVDRHASDRGSGIALPDACRPSLPPLQPRSRETTPPRYDTLLPARRRSSAAFATSTSSNGSTRSPIT